MVAFVFMGVMGSGKTTIGKNVADRLSLAFYDAGKPYLQVTSLTHIRRFPLHSE
jgi:shikimate kinase